MNILNFDIGAGFAWLLTTASRRPARLIGIFTSILVLTAAAALGFPTARIPLFIASSVALLAILAIGTVATAMGQSAHDADDDEPPEAQEKRERDHRLNMNLVHLNTDTYRKWQKGGFANPGDAQRLRDDVLEAVIASKAGRLQNSGLKSASIVIIRRDSDYYLVRRIGGPLKARLSRGDRCRANSDLKEALRRYAPYSYYEWISCCGKDVAIAVTADVPIKGFLKDEVERFMLFYQTQYERLRFFELVSSTQAGRLRPV